MGRLVKLVIYMVVLAFLALVAYAYLGPYFGVDFSAPQTETREPINLEAD